MNKLLKNMKANWQSYLIILLLLVLIGGSSVSTMFTSGGNMMFSKSYSEGVSMMADSRIMPYYGSDDALSYEDRKLIKNGNINIETPNYDFAKNSIVSSIKNYDGIILSDSESKDINDNRYTNIRAKVNSENLETLMNEIKSLGEVKSLNIYSNDVTGSYVDYNDRLKRYNEQIEKYQLMLESDKISIEEEVQVQSRIDQLEDQIYYLTKNLGDLNEDITYSDVYVSISESPSILEEVNFLGFKDMGIEFMSSLKGGISFVLKLIGYLIPVIVLYGIYRIGRKYF